MPTNTTRDSQRPQVSLKWFKNQDKKIPMTRTKNSSNGSKMPRGRAMKFLVIVFSIAVAWISTPGKLSPKAVGL